MADGRVSAIPRASPTPARAGAPHSGRDKRPSRRNPRLPAAGPSAEQQAPQAPAYGQQAYHYPAAASVRAAAGAGRSARQSPGTEQPRQRAQCGANARFRQLPAHAAAGLRATGAPGSSATASAAAAARQSGAAGRRSHSSRWRLSPDAAARGSAVRPAPGAAARARRQLRRPPQLRPVASSRRARSLRPAAYLPGDAAVPGQQQPAARGPAAAGRLGDAGGRLRRSFAGPAELWSRPARL